MTPRDVRAGYRRRRTSPVTRPQAQTAPADHPEPRRPRSRPDRRRRRRCFWKMSRRAERRTEPSPTTAAVSCATPTTWRRSSPRRTPRRTSAAPIVTAPSDAHIADESWASGGNGTAPDIMYTRDKINPPAWPATPRIRSTRRSTWRSSPTRRAESLHGLPRQPSPASTPLQVEIARS